MKRLFLLAFLFSALTTQLFADGSVGCGLGSMIFKDNSIFSALFRSTTNHSFSTQLFGITTGTSGCTKHSIVQNEKMPLYYAEANLDRLKIEIAQGSGEYLNGFALVMGCNPTSISTFNSYLQNNYETFIPSNKVTADAFIKTVNEKIKSHALLKQNCIQVI